ncbi:MAG: hypothetical protein F9K23_16080 [Bacteroidetes bacterium]|nr:MAG: hypothetical protein F9K23_16080 [Bacteroidota bacterium]
MHKAILYKALLAALLMFGLNSCKNEAPKKTEVVIPKGISAIKVFLDNSESNIGYMRGATKFKAIITNFTAEINNPKLAAHSHFNLIADSISPLNYSPEQFIDAVANSKIEPAKCSEMHKMVEMLTTNLDSFDIGILVSDCILSYCDTKGNPNKNRDNAESEQKTYVKSIFKKLNTKGVCASVYAFKSDFNGRYFTYNNKIQYYKNEVRPFYVWAIGRKEQLMLFNAELLKTTRPDAQLHFGFDTEPKASFALFFKTGKKGTCEINKDNISDIVVKADKPVGFVMGINLDSLPPYAQTIEYVKKNLSIGFEYLKLKDVKLRKDFELLQTNNREKLFRENNTHFLYFEIEDLITDTPVEITLDNKTDTWYEDWSTMDDLTTENNNEKTFALIHLINGVKEAYEVKHTSFLKVKLTLKQ